MKRIIPVILAVMLAACCMAQCEPLQEKSFPADAQYVKLTGRTITENGIRWMIHSAGKAEFRFRGTHASVVIVGDGAASGPEESRARFAVYVNGEQVLDTLVSQREETFEIFSAEEETEAEVMIIKLSEAANSIFGIKEITVTSGGDIEPLPPKELKIEFIGDSITCGYGVDDEDRNHHFATGTENAMKSYAYKTAAALDADYSMVSYSGHGIISGYTGTGNKEAGQLVPPVYELAGKNYGSAASAVNLRREWDFSAFRPDIVVINLGTNDDSYTQQYADRKEEFTAAYAEFLKTVRKNNPDAYIVAVSGTMGDGLFPNIKEAVRRYSEETGDTRIEAYRLPPQDGSTGFAADWHPTEATHEKAAKLLAEKLASIR